MSGYSQDDTARFPEPPYGRQPSNQPPQYGRPQYGQPPYGQQPYGQQPRQGRPANPFGPESNETFGITGAVLGLLGAIAGIVAFTSVDWFGGSVGSIAFGDVQVLGPTGFANAYYSWLAWAFLIIGAVCAVASSFPNPAMRMLRIIGVVIGFAAAGLSFLALQVNQATSYLTYLESARIGFYLAVLAYILIGIGAAYGPRREIRRS